MAFSLATITICGKVGRDPEQKSPTAPVQFSVACDQGYGDKKRTNWFTVKVFGKAGEIALQHVSKGQQATINGRFETDVYTNKDGKEVTSLCVIANDVVSVDLKPREQERDGSW